jgi:hypothetical protein
MNSVKFKLERGVKIQWPSYCAMCGSKATHEASTSFTATKNIGYYVVVITFKHQTYSISYPVCRKHKIICNLLDHPARESLLNITLFIFITSLILWGLFYLLFLSIFDLVGLNNISRIYQEYGWQWTGLIALVLVMLYVSGIFKPVRISNIEEDSMIISIKNNKFFNDFKILNSDKVMNN